MFLPAILASFFLFLDEAKPEKIKKISSIHFIPVDYLQV